eukprot:gene3809-biopygen1491
MPRGCSRPSWNRSRDRHCRKTNGKGSSRGIRGQWGGITKIGEIRCRHGWDRLRECWRWEAGLSGIERLSHHQHDSLATMCFDSNHGHTISSFDSSSIPYPPPCEMIGGLPNDVAELGRNIGGMLTSTGGHFQNAEWCYAIDYSCEGVPMKTNGKGHPKVWEGWGAAVSGTWGGRWLHPAFGRR